MNDLLPEAPMTGLAPSEGHAARPPADPSDRGRPAAADTDVPSATAGRVRARTLLTIRWIAVGGQLATLLTVDYLLGFELPIMFALGAVFASVVLNLYAIQRLGRQPFLGDRDAGFYMGYDMLQLTLLLYLTGGLQNPFAVLLLSPLTVAASTLGRTAVTALSCVAVLCFTALAIFALPLPWPGGADVMLPPLYRVGIWVALVVSAAFLAGYLFQVAEGGRRLSAALAASQMALARAQRVSAVGALAAAAAHELGTPLGTIAVVAKELARDVPPGSPLCEDVQLLQSQVARCRDILAELSRRPGDAGGAEPFAPVPLPALVETVAAPYRRAGIELVIETLNEPEEGPPRVRETPEVNHGLGNILQNAMQFARRRVTVSIDWNAGVPGEGVTVLVADDGPGFPVGLLGRLGEPYLSGRTTAGREAGGNMGLGLFIAQTLLERSGAEIAYGNRRGGGAQVAIHWKKPTFTV